VKQITKHPLRCECMRQPILAYYGVDEKNTPYLHVKVYKARRIYGEILISSGEVQLRCRECFRWYRVVMPRKGKPQLVETTEPETQGEDSIVGLG
jgi:hypothetical protein